MDKIKLTYATIINLNKIEEAHYNSNEDVIVVTYEDGGVTAEYPATSSDYETFTAIMRERISEAGK